MKYKILDIWYRLRFVLTGDCSHGCGIVTFHDNWGMPVQTFVPEADCPVHDKEAHD